MPPSIAFARADLQFIAAHPFRHQADDAARVVGPNSVELASSDAGQRPRRLDDRHLHAEADAEIRHFALARETRRQNLAFGAALAEAAWHQNAVDMFEIGGRIVALENFGLDPIEIDADTIGDAAVASASISDL